MKEFKGIPFKSVPGHDLYLDVYLPDGEERPPLIMWIHGGGWQELNRDWNLIMNMLNYGYAVASVEYRYSDEAEFPAQMYDLKAAQLYLKKHADEFGYDAGKMVVSGDSAGGHLAIMMAVSAGNKEWEEPDEDYSFQAAVDFCGPTSFPCGAGMPRAHVIEKLLGAPTDSKTCRARAHAASPLTYIDGTEPPFLILHGSEDPIVNPSNPRALRNALEVAGVPVHMYFVPGGHHGLAGDLVDRIIAEFLDYYLKGKKTVVTPEVLDCHQRTVPINPEKY